MTHIIDTLYLGNIYDAAYNVKNAALVVNCTPDYPFYHNTGKHIRLPFEDSRKDEELLYSLLVHTSVFEEMTKCMLRHEVVFVHCYAGISRSATVVVCFMMYYITHVFHAHYDIEQIIDFVRSRRPIVFKQGFNFKTVIEKCDIDNKIAFVLNTMV